jgi:hypothetical protein
LPDPRVIEQTVRETLPEGFQRSEFLLEKGAIDMIVDRREMKDRVAALLTLLQKRPAAIEQRGVSGEGTAGEGRRTRCSSALAGRPGWHTSKASTRAGRRGSNWAWSGSSASGRNWRRIRSAR